MTMDAGAALDYLKKVECKLGITHADTFGDYFPLFEEKVFFMIESGKAEIVARRLAHICDAVFTGDLSVSFKRLAYVIDKDKYWEHLHLHK